MQTNVKEASASVEDAIGEASRIKTLVTDAVEDGVKSALKAVQQGRDAAEDAIGDARHKVTEYPFQAIGIVFAAGVLVGSLVGWLGTRGD